MTDKNWQCRYDFGIPGLPPQLIDFDPDEFESLEGVTLTISVTFLGDVRQRIVIDPERIEKRRITYGPWERL